MSLPGNLEALIRRDDLGQTGAVVKTNSRSPFFLQTTVTNLPAILITWQREKPVWVEQWPMTKERLEKATDVVQEQLKAGHI